MQTENTPEIEWKVKPDKKGAPSLFIGNRSIHSLYDAENQASQTAKRILEKMKRKGSNYLVLIGLGLGYLPEALFSLGFFDLLVWDPFPIMRKFLPIRKSPWKGHISIVQSFDELIKLIYQSAKKNTLPEIVIHPGYAPYCQLEYRQTLDCLRAVFSPKVFDNVIISERSLNSVSQIPFYRHIGSLSRRYDKDKAILVSAGPSLKKCIPYLKERKEGILFAAIQAVPLLQRNNIKIHYAVIADPFNLSGIIEECSLKFDALLAESAVHPATLSWCPQKTYLYNLYSDQLHQLLWLPECQSNIRAAISTVSETQLLLSIGMGFKEIILLGMDFSWKGKRYAYRSPNAPKCSPQEKRFFVPSIDKSFSETEPMYFHASRFMNYICKKISKDAIKFYQYTEGIPITKAEQILASDIPKILSSIYTKKHSFKERNIDPSLVSLAESLITEAADSEHIAYQNVKSLPLFHSFFSEKSMPFFKEIPPEKRKSICMKYLEKLRKKTPSLL